MALNDHLLEQRRRHQVREDQGKELRTQFTRHRWTIKLSAPGLTIVDRLVGQVEGSSIHARLAQEQEDKEAKTHNNKEQQDQILVPRKPK
eukprot:CAMPEP_0179154898 /NCGR_PEP_ID=MMETSP0796-20121207/75420_1 /TAXON_ID=73915 /ORGANISM="Pyrodinium bahamense, Strain pbaha01" /LENGTH=89 /DNA_ID=CAMNT_0020856329 /DNA_START=36 /DNA_END=305 /DNA_ORIENTATION=+